MKKLIRSMILFSVILMSSEAFSGAISMSIGPEQIGSGGAAPLAVPPSDPFQWAFSWATDAGWETTVSLNPGLVFGYRMRAGGLFLSLGGGLIVDGNGSGIGPYSTFGYESGGGTPGWHFLANYTQALGYSSGHYIAPSAMRFGAIWEY